MICPITTTSYLLGTTFIGLGALAFASPAQAQLTFGVRPTPSPSPSSSAATASSGNLETQAFIYSKAARDIALGALLVLFQYRRNKSAVTAVTGLTAFAGLVDGLACYKFAPADLRPKAWGHFAGSATIFAVTVVRYRARLW
ncbi:DUF4267 domain-containing protein [Microdochium nivale]|nr:DUF4267 domain-containing protein [Microdochium nivale]